MNLDQWRQVLDGHEGIRSFDLTEDRVLIRRIEEPSSIEMTDKPKGIKGVILGTGPGKWIPGEWYKVGEWFRLGKKSPWLKAGEWEWFPGHRQYMEVKPGMSVLFNSKWNDFTSGENKGTGSDFSGPLARPLPLKADPMIHLIREADIFCVIPDLNISASVKPQGAIEREFMQTKEIKGPWNGGDLTKRELLSVNGKVLGHRDQVIAERFSK